jgi:hypothetical protein
VAGSCGYGEELSSSINAGNFLTSCKVYWLASQKGFCSMEKVYRASSVALFLFSLLFMRVHKIAKKKQLLVLSCLSVCPHEKTQLPTRRIFHKI